MTDPGGFRSDVDRVPDSLLALLTEPLVAELLAAEWWQRAAATQ